MKDYMNVQVHPATMAGTPGLVCVPNESMLSGSNYQEAIVGYIAGVMGTDLSGLRDLINYLAPGVETARIFQYQALADGLAFLADQNDERAPGAEFRRIETKGSMQTDKTRNRGLSYRIDRDAVPIGPNTVNNTAAWLMAILLRNDALRAISVLDAAATNQAKTWDGSANPDGDLRASRALSHTARGLSPNRLAIGLSAWDTRAAAYEASSKAGALMLAERTPKEVANKIGIASAMISDMIYKVKKTGSNTMAMANIIYMFYADMVAHEMDASNVKRFWSRCNGGEEYAVYTNESDPKFIDVVVEHYSTIAVTDTTGIRKLTIS